MITEIKNEYLSVKILRKGAQLQSVKMAEREYLWNYSKEKNSYLK